jgi:protein-S-isoprenylcysteine O-methyltransferase Ste14
MKLKDLMGSGDKIMLLAAPFLVLGLVLNILFPAWFGVGGPPLALKVISIILLIPGVVLWLWSVVLILLRVPQKKLITDGPYALAKHPLYTAVALLVLPWLGFLLDSWLGVVVGLAIYIGSRLYSPAEEEGLSKTFGPAWDAYRRKVLLPWL